MRDLGRSTRRRIALYSHDTVGLGHLRRNLAIASSLVATPVPTEILLISGSRESLSFPIPAGIDILALPALAKRDGSYTARTLGASLEEVIDLRSSIIAAALSSFEPDVFIVDKVARGVCRELDPALRQLAESGRTRCVLGLRDVLDDFATTSAEWQSADTVRAITDLYDAVWIYGDATVFDLAREHALPDAVVERTTFTGYLGHGRPRTFASADACLVASPYVLCLVGGGQDGIALADAFSAESLGRPGVVVTGPYMDPAERRRLSERAEGRGDLTILEFVDDCGALIAGAEAVVSMGGYNTVCELLAAGQRPLVVPRVTPRTEQLIRAGRLADRGLVDVLHPDQLTPAALRHWLESRSAANGARLHGDDLAGVDLEGLARIPRLVEQVLGHRTRRGVLAHDAA